MSNRITYSFLALLLLPLFCGCSSEEERSLQQGDETTVRMVTMQFDGELLGFQGDTRVASALTFSRGDSLFLTFDKTYHAKAYYSGSDWTVAIPTSLTAGSGSCEAFYFQNGKVDYGKVILNEESVVYYGKGTFSNTTSLFTVSASVSPFTARLRFRGASGTQIRVKGLVWYDYYDPSAGVPSPCVGSTASLTVLSSGYTPYIYVTCSGSLELQSGAYIYTRKVSSSLMQAGHSGYIDIPTPTSHSGWETDEKNEADISGDDYGTTDDWNQSDPDKADISGDDYGTTDDWNQPDPDHADLTGDEYNDDENWNPDSGL